MYIGPSPNFFFGSGGWGGDCDSGVDPWEGGGNSGPGPFLPLSNGGPQTSLRGQKCHMHVGECIAF